MGAVWLTEKVKVEVHTDYLLCHGLLYADWDSVTHMVLVMSYILIQIGTEEKYMISFFFVIFQPYPTLDSYGNLFPLIKTKEQ